MTSQEVREKLNTHRARMDRALRDIATCARHLVPVLKDAHATASAEELSRLLFVYDSEEAELMQWTSQNAESLIRAMVDSMGGRKEGA